ncbi:acetyl-CoA C-acyltransferase [Rhodobacteraceae bacterium DSL-40]|uniref:acetyl-CoA C-acyltransferase n=1 Tax=Amaricoccus sp. B4 TaxID=3368557 RepID=UPI000DACFC4B
MRPAYVIAARRTPVAPRGGALARTALHDLAAAPLRACLADAGLAPEAVDEVILANALGAGGNPARAAALAAGLPERVGGLSIDRQCCGGLDALRLAALMVGSGVAEAVLAGGAESYSLRPFRAAPDPEGGPPVPYDQARFTPWPERDPPMHAAADALGRKLGIGRAAQDAWAVASHAKARATGPAAGEIAPVPGTGLAADSFTRRLGAGLAARAPVVLGTITGANAAVAADGAAACLVVSGRLARAAGCPATRIGASAALGGDPELPGLAPVAAIGAALAAEGLGPEALGVAEIMEAYAVQAIACVAGAGLDPARVNPGGGALARGHPVGASGAILAVRLHHELLARGGTGLAAIAAGGGLGTALILQACPEIR